MRAVIANEDRKIFFDSVKVKGGGFDKVGKLVGISGKTLRDWRAGKVLPRYETVEKLSFVYEIVFPKILELREEWWSGRVNGSRAAKIRVDLYGPPGTSSGRIKGGTNSQIKRREDPDYYRNLGCLVRNSFKVPKKSNDLAEFVGIVLGDGSLTRDQCHISLHINEDKEYAEHVKRLIYRLFGYKASICLIKKSSVRIVLVSGITFVEMLENFGLRVGNKVKNQVDIPDWIKRNEDFCRYCVRGLYDTDGGSFIHKHKVKNRIYINFGLTFTSASEPMLRFFSKNLSNFEIKHSKSGICLFMYRAKSIDRFFEIFKPNNKKHFSRYQKYLKGGYL